MSVLVTGASGFIGRYCVARLSALGRDEIIGVGRTAPDKTNSSNVRWIAADLLDRDAVDRLIARERPTHLLHLAWTATPGLFWNAIDNLDWTAASLLLQRKFADCGGRRIVTAGTCAEYDWTGSAILDERQTSLVPNTLYGAAKDALRRLSQAAAATQGIEAAWGRIFWLYGPDEKRGRLVADVSADLIAGVPIDCSAGTQARDFMHVADVAGALIAALYSDWTGAFNVGSGRAVPVRDVVTLLAQAAGRSDLVRFGTRPSAPNEPPSLAADVRILRDSIGYRTETPLDVGLADTVQWWRTRSSM